MGHTGVLRYRHGHIVRGCPDRVAFRKTVKDAKAMSFAYQIRIEIDIKDSSGTS